MKNQLIDGLFLLILTFIIGCTGCGGGGGGGADDGTGSTVNDGWETTELSCNGTVAGGTFSSSSGDAAVFVQNGEISSCVNATANPTFAATGSLPAGFDITTSEGDVNATSGGTGFAFDINGTSGFATSSEGAVTITLPFDPSLVPAADRTSLKVFVRVFNNEDNSVVDVDGTISGNSITIETRGLPKQFTAAAIYNPNMDEADSSLIDPSIVESPNKNVTNPAPWPARKWCVIYNAANAELIAAVKSVDSIAGTPTAAQLKSAVQTYVANAAANNQTTYEAALFRAPNLFIASNAAQPCGSFGTTKRYNIYLKAGSTVFRPDDAGEVVSPDGNRYGRIYMSPKYIANAVTAPLGSVRSIVAHETLHAIQNGYELFGTTNKGYREGTATLFQMTINNGGTIAVRSANERETQLLSDYLTADSSGGRGLASYANQDFFAYVGKKYNGGSLSYLSGLFEKMHTDIEAHAASIANAGQKEAFKKQPTRDILFGAMDSYFKTGLSTTGALKDIYLDFLRQRAIDHNADSQFGRSGETVIGFASNLFQTSSSGAQNAVATVIVNADDCSLGGESGTFGNVAPFAARAIKITAGTTNSSGRKITVRLTPASGTIGDTFGGYSNWKGSTNAVSASNEFTSFGKTSSDEVDIVVANTTMDRKLYIDYAVSCDTESGGGGTGGLNSFSFTQFTTAETFTPAIGLGRDIAIVVGSNASDINAVPNLIVFFNSTITAAGTYTLSLNNSPADLMYYTSSIYSYEQTGGTLTLTAFGRNAGDHMTGSFSMTVADDSPTTRTGVIAATFDFVVGEQNAL